MAAREYGQYCGITQALELVGELDRVLKVTATGRTATVHNLHVGLLIFISKNAGKYRSKYIIKQVVRCATHLSQHS